MVVQSGDQKPVTSLTSLLWFMDEFPLLFLALPILLSQIPGWDFITGVLGGIKDVRQHRKSNFIAELREPQENNEVRYASAGYTDKQITQHEDVQEKFFNAVIDEQARVMARLFRLRHNGWLFQPLAGDTPGTIGTIKVLRMHSLTPTYSYGFVKASNPDFLKVLRQYYPEPKMNGRVGIFHDTAFAIDTRHDYYREAAHWHGQVFYPVSSHAPRSYNQDFIYTKGREKYYNGECGDNTTPRSAISGVENDYPNHQGRDFLGLFNDRGTGSKLEDYYNTNDSYHSWSWEVLAGQPEVYPLEVPSEGAWPVLKFRMKSVRFTSKDNCVNDWQPNMMHATFEDETGSLHSIKMVNTKNSKCVWRDSFAFGTTTDHEVPTHQMGQWTDESFMMFMMVGNRKIQPGWKFWGFAMSAWIGNNGASKRKRVYTVHNFQMGLQYNDEYKTIKMYENIPTYKSYSDYYFKEVLPKYAGLSVDEQQSQGNQFFTLPEEDTGTVGVVDVTPEPTPEPNPLLNQLLNQTPPEPTPEPNHT